jgi:glycosyltransferase involved in cell wall biosynthesis
MRVPNTEISVIIPVRGKIELLARAINSCIVQSSIPGEIIVVDDSVNEEEHKNITKVTSEFVQTIEEAQLPTSLIQLYSNGKGASTARNLGIKRSNGRYLAFLDADDFFLPDKLSIQIDIMDSQNADFSHTNYIAMNNGYFPNLVVTSLNQGYEQDVIISYRGCSIATPTVMISGSLAREIGDLFPADLSVGEDQVGWVRMAQRSEKPFIHVNQALSIVSVDAKSSSQNKSNIEKANLYLIKHAQKTGIAKPRFYQYSGILIFFRRIIPHKSILWRIARAVYREIRIVS